MASFGRAISIVLDHEGGFVNHPKDPGGATNWGVSLRFLQQEGILLDLDGDGDMDWHDVKAMSREQAVAIYKERFWDRYGYEQLVSEAVAAKIFDTCVNTGARQAHLFAQRALRANCAPVVEDGVLGSVTIRALNAVPDKLLLPALRSEQAGFYRALVAQRPQQYGVFLEGWLNRAYA